MLENNSTAYIFRNHQMVKNIFHAGGRYIMIHCNVRKPRVKKESTLKGYRAAWFDEGAIAKILFLIRIREKYPVRY